MIAKFLCAFGFCGMIFMAGSNGALFPYTNYVGTFIFGGLFVVTGLKFLP